MDIARPVSNMMAMPSTPSLYQQTMTTIEQLYSIPGFEHYLFPEGLGSLMETTDGRPMIDPVAVLWGCFRLGAPLCFIVNMFDEYRRAPLSVPDVSQLTTYNNVCKKCVYHFLIACKELLGLPEDQLFTISELYRDDTSGFVKTLKTINMVIAELQKRKVFPPLKKLPFNQTGTPGQEKKPADNRSRTIDEMLVTERKYIQDLQALMTYRQELSRHSMSVSKDLIIHLFANLGELLDFQRRFLIAMEATLSLPSDEQRIGALFTTNEEAFSVYEPICGNYQAATELAAKDAEYLRGLGSLDPVTELPSYLIKPVQRLCKYPLLLKEIIKLSTGTSYAYLSELREGYEAIKRVVDSVNERQRKDENKLLKNNLANWVADWRGFDIGSAGDLVLSDRFNMSTPDGDKEYHVFLFEQVLLCCKDQGKKKRKNTKEEQLTYAIRGNILLTSIVETVNASKPAEQQFGIRIYWKDVADMESFSLKCRNEEQVILWKQRLELLIDEQRLRRRSAQSEDRNSHHIPAHVIGSNTMRFSSGDLESVRSWDDRDSRDARSSTHSTRSFALQSPDPNRILGSPRRSRGPSSSGQNTGDGGQRTASLQGGTRTYRSGTASSADYRYLSENSQSSPSDYDANDRWSFRSSNPGPPPPSALPATPLTSPVDSIGFPFSSNNRSSSDLRASSGLYRTSLKEEQFAEDLRKLNVNAEGEGATLYKSDPQLKSSQSATSLAQSNSSIGPSISSGFIKVKLFYANDIFVIALPSTSCTLSELTSKIERKLRLCGMALPEGKTLKLKYKDEDNDLIQIYGDDDIIMALDTSRMDRGPEGDRGIVHIYVE